MTKYKLSRFKDRDTRKVFGTILGGKMLGILGALALMQAFIWLFGNVAEAAGLQEAATVSDDLVNPINTVWVLVAAFLVFFMQAGFMALEAGFARSRETVNIMMECIFDTCLCGLLYWAVGFAFQFGAGNGLIGHEFFFLHDAPATYGTTGIGLPRVLAVPVRLRRHRLDDHLGRHGRADQLQGRHPLQRRCLGVHLPDLRPLGLGPGRLARQHDRQLPDDFTGGACSVTSPARPSCTPSAASSPWPVPSCSAPASGASSPRTAAARRRRTTSTSPPSARSSCGSAGTASTPAPRCRPWTGRASAGSRRTPRWRHAPAGWWPCCSSTRGSKKWDVGMAINGFLGGLVAITAPCYWVSPLGAVIIGGIAGIVVSRSGSTCWRPSRIDDPIGAVAVHGFCGIWGTLAVGLFATGEFGIPGPLTVPTTRRRRQGPVLRRRHRPAQGPAHRQPDLRGRRARRVAC